jgi:signal transduction histidine kinase/CheY-like chemotaxis protein
MRRETDFVLEQAAWPALVLEGTGLIRRFNGAALRVFGDGLKSSTVSLETFWAGESAFSAAEFFERGVKADGLVVLKSAEGRKTTFSVHINEVARDSRSYFLAQFLDCAPGLSVAAPVPVAEPPKPVAPPVVSPEAQLLEYCGMFEEAEWPVLLTQSNGMILRANRAAVEAFGSSISRTSTALAGYWLPEDRLPLLDFLRSTEVELTGTFRLKTGLPTLYTMRAFHPSAGLVVLQFLKQAGRGLPMARSPRPEMSVILPTPSGAAVAGALLGRAAPPTAPTMPTPENPLIHKQKLDCALQLARSISLDFNNALTSILGHTSLLLTKLEPGSPWRDSLVEIEKSAAKAAEVASDLANFSRQEKDTRSQMAGNINTLLERAVDAFRAEHPSVAWSMQLERRLCAASFDEAKMQQAFVKLLENAVQSFKGPGRISLQTLNLELTEATQDRTAKLMPGNYVCVEISDNGSGISPEILPRIFEPFFTTKGREHRGLGLAWVYGIITNHGGAVAVSSQVGVGTSVRVYLPSTRKIVRGTPPVINDLTGNQTVLLVDDEVLLLTMGERILSSYGYRVITANSGAKAIEIINRKERPIHLMVTDLVMPGMSGRELTEKVRQLSPETRILWTSGYVRESSGLENEGYLQKPFTSQDFLRKVKESLMDI